MRNALTPKALYRKVNTTARGVWHRHGADARDERNTKAAKKSAGSRGSMHGKKQRGLDYTPLFRFLLSKVGQDWDKVHSEAVSRLDREDPIFHMVALREDERAAYFCGHDNSYFSGLYVDDDNRLALVDPYLTVDDLKPTCGCCTHTFNGERFTRAYGF